MHNIWLIARREYLERIRTRSFIVMTLLIPAFMLAVTVLPTLLMTRISGGVKHFMVVAPDVSTAGVIREELSNPPDEQKGTEGQLRTRSLPLVSKFIVDVGTDTSDAKRIALAEKVKQKQLDGVIFVTKEGLAGRKVTLITRDISGLISNEQIRGSIGYALRRQFLKNKGLTDQEVENALQPVALDTQSPSGGANPVAVFVTVLSMAMILYVTVLLYGINVMRAILEEKTSRIMEVMLSIVQAREMMAGKISGVGAVGLTQIGIWAIMGLLASSPLLIGGAGMIRGILSLKLLVYFALFFLLGYVLYSTLCAAVGSIVNSEQEAQQLQFVVMLPMVASVIIMGNVIQSPESTTAVWASLFPLTAPLIMFLRVALASPPGWQVGLSIGLMTATTYGLVWLCARIYRVGILMYGKKPTLPEIIKWVRYA